MSLAGIKESRPCNHEQSPQTPIVIYQSADGSIATEVRALEGETVWLSQAQLIELFRRDQSVISRHIRGVFAEGELQPESNMQKMHIANSDKPVTLYSLDVIICARLPRQIAEGLLPHLGQPCLAQGLNLVQGYALNHRGLESAAGKDGRAQTSYRFVCQVDPQQGIIATPSRKAFWRF